MEPRSRRVPPSSIFLGSIVLLGILAYANTFNVPFLFDDIPNIVNNPLLRRPAALTGFLTSDSPAPTTAISRNRLTGYLTFAVNYKLHGLDVRGYHVFNLSVHILNALLVYALVVLTFRTPFFSGKRGPDGAADTHKELTALFTALLFVAHPIETQAVTYIVQRFASLATLFFLISLVAYVQARLPIGTAASGDLPKNRIPLRLPFYAIALIAALAAMNTKEIAWTLPLVIALYELLFFKGAVLRRASYLLPLLLTMLVIPLNLVRAGKPMEELLRDLSEASRVQTTLSRVDYFFTQLRVILTYLRLLFFPVNQNLDYDYPIFHSIFDPQVMLSALVLCGILGIAVYLYSHSESTNSSLRLTAFGILWFFITLLVESSFLPIVDVIFEHRVYLPSIGFFIAISAAAYCLAGIIKGRWRWAGHVTPAGLICIVAILAGMTYRRNIVWADAVTFWSDVVNKSPKKARGYNNLGLAYRERGQFREAMHSYQAAAKLQPSYAAAQNNIADLYYLAGLHDRAIEHGEIAINLKADYAEAHNTTALAYFAKGSYKKAIEHFRSATTLNPLYAEAHSNLGAAYASDGAFEKAIESFQAALKLNPGLVGVRKNLAVLYEKMAQREKTKEYSGMGDRPKK